ncbi:MFS transporter [Anaeromyxobacter diazotrophicus]|uniref:MFS transporter n=1 Tax=Anaeromyxobacter diazotrophicus TaxID=2590199 RepID=A0A7I9VJ74_9BACT|nr:MFS transporter [Anaeromyxobacter diazotrophicus]GEJ56462.1 MFS transporter [Anaeromyxobacter diazotrophicus]
MAAGARARGSWLHSDVPGRLDRLPWSRWHLRLVVALGITWVLDGLEVTLVGAVAGVLAEPATLHLSERQLGLAASGYLLGAILGALLFGRLTDALGRKRLFLVTLGVYTAATLLTALAWGFGSFVLFRALTGAGIGGEYAAINSAIDELMPARLRGRADLAINSTYWLGTALGSAATLLLLDPHVLPPALGWRACFAIGGALGLAVLGVRRHVPESPRWLLLHGREHDAERVIAAIESEVTRSIQRPLAAPAPPRPFQVKGAVGFGVIARVLLRQHLRRTVLGLALMVAQAFAYNAIFFTYALILGRFYGVPSDRVGLYLLPFAAGNLLGPLALGKLFDTVGRRAMIALTYGLSGVLLAGTGWAFAQGWLTAATQTALWCAVFFVASAAASSAYLTVSELFPVELRGLAIALFFAVGTAAGGLVAPALFGALIQSGSRTQVMHGYLAGAALMLAAAAVAAVLGVAAEGRSLEALAEAGAPGAAVRPPEAAP